MDPMEFRRAWAEDKALKQAMHDVWVAGAGGQGSKSVSSAFGQKAFDAIIAIAGAGVGLDGCIIQWGADTNGDGTLDKEELLAALLDICGGEDLRQLDDAAEAEQEAQAELCRTEEQLQELRDEMAFMDAPERIVAEECAAAILVNLLLWTAGKSRSSRCK